MSQIRSGWNAHLKSNWTPNIFYIIFFFNQSEDFESRLICALTTRHERWERPTRTSFTSRPTKQPKKGKSFLLQTTTSFTLRREGFSSLHSRRISENYTLFLQMKMCSPKRAHVVERKTGSVTRWMTKNLIARSAGQVRPSNLCFSLICISNACDVCWFFPPSLSWFPILCESNLFGWKMMHEGHSWGA